jgi:hypothetical protein
MLRAILAVVVGYLVMAAIVIPAFTLPIFLPSDWVWEKDSLEVTKLFLIVTLAVSLVGAVGGGWVAALIARRRDHPAVFVLAGLVLVLGLFSAAGNSLRETPVKSPQQVAAMTFKERAEVATQPVWYAFTLPVLGCVGVLVGARLRRGP